MEREDCDREAEAKVVARWHRGGRVVASECTVSVEVVDWADTDGVGQLSASVSLSWSDDLPDYMRVKSHCGAHLPAAAPSVCFLLAVLESTSHSLSSLLQE